DGRHSSGAGASTLGAAARAVDNGAIVARSGVCALAGGGRGAAAAHYTDPGDRHFSRASVAGHRALSHERRAFALDTGAAVAFGVSGIECAHVCDGAEKAGGVVLQPGCGECDCRQGGALVVSSAVLQGQHEMRTAEWLDSLCERAHTSWRPRGRAG